MSTPIENIVVVGGGTAGWITACVLASTLGPDRHITLVESPNIPTVGVGEGTWPSMRMTLQRIGLSEKQFLQSCDASFKQGTQFIGWRSDTQQDVYAHPFSLPLEYSSINLANYWSANHSQTDFGGFVSPQSTVAQQGYAPKLPDTPDYAFILNYGYHLDAGKFADCLKLHATKSLQVQYVQADVEHVVADEDNFISKLLLSNGATLSADFFVDCTGQRALLLGEHYRSDSVSVKDVLFNDMAVAVQVPYEKENDAIASLTKAAAQDSGWIWDIGLQSRRGLGYVCSSEHIDEDSAIDTLRTYVDADALWRDRLTEPRTLRFEPAYRTEPWVKNCMAIGLSAGFVEPLEASAIALIEQSATFLADNMPQTRASIPALSRRFNQKMQYHWQRIVEFLKLHYAVSQRQSSDYWLQASNPATFPDTLSDKLAIWQQQAPWHEDAPRLDELFPSASYQYVLYGMGFQPSTTYQSQKELTSRSLADRALHSVQERAQLLAKQLPSNRQLLTQLLAA